MLGGAAVGKSSLVSQFMTSEYLHAYDTSIGMYKMFVLFIGFFISIIVSRCEWIFVFGLLGVDSLIVPKVHYYHRCKCF